MNKLIKFPLRLFFSFFVHQNGFLLKELKINKTFAKLI